jgi:hypothetical protein
MSKLASELERLARAVQALDGALEAQEARHGAKLAEARGETEVVARRVDSAIHRIESVLGE